MQIPEGKDCWSCHWCWLGRCMHGCNYGKDVSEIVQCNEYVSKEDYAKLKKPMTRDRAMELLNAYIVHLSVAENNETVIKKLLFIGFTEDELVVDFGFNREEVKDAAEDMDEYED